MTPCDVIGEHDKNSLDRSTDSKCGDLHLLVIE